MLSYVRLSDSKCIIDKFQNNVTKLRKMKKDPNRTFKNYLSF
jgi:hypothetical protein